MSLLPSDLRDTVLTLRSQFADVTHVTTADVSRLLPPPPPASEPASDAQQRRLLLLVDARSSAEFAVSRLPGAVHIGHNVCDGELVRRLAEALKHATSVGRCSTGHHWHSDSEQLFSNPQSSHQHLIGHQSSEQVSSDGNCSGHRCSDQCSAVAQPVDQSSDWQYSVQHCSPGLAAPAARPTVLLVCYCAVGFRSALLARRLAAARALTGALLDTCQVVNLEGSIFQWATEGRRLEGGPGVHPYSEQAGRMLRRDLWNYGAAATTDDDCDTIANICETQQTLK